MNRSNSGYEENEVISNIISARKPITMVTKTLLVEVIAVSVTFHYISDVLMIHY